MIIKELKKLKFSYVMFVYSLKLHLNEIWRLRTPKKIHPFYEAVTFYSFTMLQYTWFNTFSNS